MENREIYTKKSYLVLRMIIAASMVIAVCYIFVVFDPDRRIYAPPFFGRAPGQLGELAFRIFGVIATIGFIRLGWRSWKQFSNPRPEIICSDEGLLIEEIMKGDAVPWNAITGLRTHGLKGFLQHPYIDLDIVDWHRYAKKHWLGIPARPKIYINGFTATPTEIVKEIESRLITD